MRVRTAEAPDVAAIRILVRDAYAAYVADIGREPAPMTVDDAARVASGLVHVADIESEVVGMIAMWPETDHWCVDNVAVAPHRHGTGIGTHLIERAEVAARAAGLYEIRLYTNVAMTTNLGWYPRRGFVETHRAIEDGYERVYFTRALR